MDEVTTDAAVLGVALRAVYRCLDRFAPHTGNARNGLAFHDVNSGLKSSVNFEVRLVVDDAGSAAARAGDADMTNLVVAPQDAGLAHTVATVQRHGKPEQIKASRAAHV